MTVKTHASPWPWRRELGELLQLAGPVIVARLGIMVMGLTDAIVVGRYSAEQLGFHALGWAPTNIVLTTAVGLLTGVQVMTSRYIGQGRPHATGGVLRRGLVYSLWLGIASALLLIAFGPMLLHAMGLAPALAQGASRPLQVFALSLPAYLVSVAATFYLEALGRPKPGMVAMWACNGVNLGLNLLFVPGTWGLPAMGAVGAGFATLGARTALAAFLLIYIVRMKDARALGVFDKPSDGRPATIEQRRIGYGAGGSYFVEAGAFAGMNIVAGWVGGLVVAGWAVVLNVSAIVFMFPLGLATATGVMVGRAYGARDPVGVVRAGLLGFAVSIAIGVAMAAALLLTATQVAGVYTTDPALIALTVPALVLACLFFIPDALQVVVAQSLRARGDVLVPTVTHVMSYALLMLPLGWWLSGPRGMGLNGILWAAVAASFMSGGLLLGRFLQLAQRER